ncbi:hypothetical protein PPGU16_84500 (plasmid) [Paraburkholderia largidicola]|uniref:Uncharacterized protein n=1 Tax=Paraburkholderia largidicola TaxID=3014751 RepID=A0A7I8C3J4_9BURK|nr:hypothetical protein PPGU16_84500 [Paraburkholderia sp. PGU16]
MLLYRNTLGGIMCYGSPHEQLAMLLEAHGETKNDLGHTALDDFEHFCAYSGLSRESAGEMGFAWSKLAYVTVWTTRNCSQPENARAGKSDADPTKPDVAAALEKLKGTMRGQ